MFRSAPPQTLFRLPSIAICLWLATPTVFLQQSTAWGQAARPQAVEQAEVDRWVVGLGAEDYLLRMKSEEEILRIGSAAIARIRQATESPDIEVSIRANRLLATLLQQDFESRKKNFLAAPANSQDDFGFQYWLDFSKWVGRSDKSKRLFIDIMQNRREKELGKGEAGSVSYLGYLSTEQEQYTPLPTTAVEIADELLKRLTKPKEAVASNNPLVIQQLSLSGFEANLPKTLVKTVTESEYAEQIRTMIVGWIQANSSKNGLSENQIETIYRFELAGFTDDLYSEIEDERSKVRPHAAEAIAKIGGSNAVKLLQSFVRGDQEVVAYPDPASGKSLKITLGDIVFQLVLSLEKQPVKDFGLLRTSGTMLFSDSPVYGFADRQSANDAILRWESGRQ